MPLLYHVFRFWKGYNINEGLSYDDLGGLHIDVTTSHLLDLESGQLQELSYSSGGIFNGESMEVYVLPSGGEGFVPVSNVTAKNISTNEVYDFMDLEKYGNESMYPSQSDDALLAINEMADQIVLVIKEFNSSPQVDVVIPAVLYGEVSYFLNLPSSDHLYSARDNVVVIGNEENVIIIQFDEAFKYLSHTIGF